MGCAFSLPPVFAALTFFARRSSPRDSSLSWPTTSQLGMANPIAKSSSTSSRCRSLCRTKVNGVRFGVLRFELTLSTVLYGHILRPLQLLSISADDEWLADWVGCLTNLVLNWATRDDWKSEGDGARRVCLSSVVEKRLMSCCRRSAFGALEPDAAYLRGLQALVEYGDHIISAGILVRPTSLLPLLSPLTLSPQTFPDSVTFRSASLSFFEASLSLPLEHELPVVVIPSPSFTFTCLLASESMSISRICGIIARSVLSLPRLSDALTPLHRLREALTSQASAVSPNDPTNVELVNYLNTYLVDFVNCIWSKRLLNSQGANAMGLIPCVPFLPFSR